MPRSLQHLIRAFDLHASVAVGMPEGSKYSCSPLATDTRLGEASERSMNLLDRGRTYRPRHTNPHSLETILGPTFVSPLGARPHPPGPNAALSVRRYLISGRYSNPSTAYQHSSPKTPNPLLPLLYTQ
jgi:hypothetical protein